jgi:CRISPR-associated protein Cas5h
MQKLISIELFADFGMLKKPDTNEPVYLTFNMLHKPVLLGILGAITGLEGFKEKGKLPDYYEKLKDLKVGIEPLKHENGNFQKTIIAYNNTTGMASKETGGNLIVTEQTLIAPAFRCYFMLDTDIELHKKIDKNLSNYDAEYLPYLGKNEFSVWWENYTQYEFKEFEAAENFKIASVFIKDKPVKDGKAEEYFDLLTDLTGQGNTFIYFERLPIGYIEIAPKQYQYEYRNFAFSDWSYRPEYKSGHFQMIKLSGNEKVIQLF